MAGPAKPFVLAATLLGLLGGGTVAVLLYANRPWETDATGERLATLGTLGVLGLAVVLLVVVAGATFLLR